MQITNVKIGTRLALSFAAICTMLVLLSVMRRATGSSKNCDRSATARCCATAFASPTASAAASTRSNG